MFASGMTSREEILRAFDFEINRMNIATISGDDVIAELALRAAKRYGTLLHDLDLKAVGA